MKFPKNIRASLRTRLPLLQVPFPALIWVLNRTRLMFTRLHFPALHHFWSFQLYLTPLSTVSPFPIFVRSHPDPTRTLHQDSSWQESCSSVWGVPTTETGRKKGFDLLHLNPTEFYGFCRTALSSRKNAASGYFKSEWKKGESLCLSALSVCFPVGSLVITPDIYWIELGSHKNSK